MSPMNSQPTSNSEILAPSDIRGIEPPKRARIGQVNWCGSLRLGRELYGDHVGFPVASDGRRNELIAPLDLWFRARFQVVSRPEW